MSDTKISALTGLSSVASGDQLPIVDVSDTTQGASGTTKQITRADLVAGLASSGANSDITSLTGLTTPLSVAQGGTGATTLTGILKGNGTSAFTAVTAPSGTIVGTSDSQTLTNKTLTSPSLTTPSITSPSVTSGDVNLATGLNIQVNSTDPKRGIYIPASGMFGATTNGAATGQIETTTNKINVKVLDFDASTEEYAWFCMPAPSYWDLGTVTAEFHWTAASSSGDVIWGIAGLARSNDDALDTALGTAVTVTDTLITANDEHLTSDTSAMTIAGTPAKDDFLFFRVYRDADAGGDTLGADARLLGVTIRFGRGQYDDQ